MVSRHINDAFICICIKYYLLIVVCTGKKFTVYFNNKTFQCIIKLFSSLYIIIIYINFNLKMKKILSFVWHYLYKT